MGGGNGGGLVAELIAGAVATVSALAGRLAWHTSQVRKGLRKFWSVELIWEAPLALMMGIVALGIAEYFGLGVKGTGALASLCGWLGPRGMEALLMLFLSRRGGGKGEP